VHQRCTYRGTLAVLAWKGADKARSLVGDDQTVSIAADGRLQFVEMVKGDDLENFVRANRVLLVALVRVLTSLLCLHTVLATASTGEVCQVVLAPANWTVNVVVFKVVVIDGLERSGGVDGGVVWRQGKVDACVFTVVSDFVDLVVIDVIARAVAMPLSLLRIRRWIDFVRRQCRA